MEDGRARQPEENVHHRDGGAIATGTVNQRPNGDGVYDIPSVPIPDYNDSPADHPGQPRCRYQSQWFQFDDQTIDRWTEGGPLW